MTNLITCSREEKIVAEESKEFGLRDAQGRVIGFSFLVWQFDYTKDENAEWSKRCWVRPEDFVPRDFTVFLRNERNGERFGQAPRAKSFKTPQEAIAYGNKKMAEAERKVIKKIRKLIESA